MGILMGYWLKINKKSYNLETIIIKSVMCIVIM